MRPLLVGEDNPHGSNPAHALYPSPVGCAGWRLCVKIMGLSEDDYLERFDRMNLCAGRWSAGEARDRAKDVLAEAYRPAIVLLGAKVCRAFDVTYAPFSALTRTATARRLVVLPHPSGRCRLWNESGAYERAREVLREAGALPPAEEVARIAALAALPRCSNCGEVKINNVCPDCGYDVGATDAKEG